MIHESAKQKSKSYFDSHRKSRLAHGGYWRHDYRYQLEEIGRIMPDWLIDTSCGPGAFLCLVEATYPKIQLNALDISPEMVKETRKQLSETAIASVGDSDHMPLESAQYQIFTNQGYGIHSNQHEKDEGLLGKEPPPDTEGGSTCFFSGLPTRRRRWVRRSSCPWRLPAFLRRSR